MTRGVRRDTDELHPFGAVYAGNRRRKGKGRVLAAGILRRVGCLGQPEEMGKIEWVDQPEGLRKD